jgi:5-methylcytosine-specific restriction endonuclease McrA
MLIERCCAHCGSTLPFDWSLKHCSSLCKDRARRLAETAEERENRRERTRKWREKQKIPFEQTFTYRRFVRRAYNDHMRCGYRLGLSRSRVLLRQALKRNRECVVCGVEHHRRYKTCSNVCAEHLYRDTRKRWKTKRRSRERAAVVEDVSRLMVFQRDSWRCRACMAATPQRLMGTLEDDAPELDHIVPLSRGGVHSYANTQCLCRVCNILKGDKLMQVFMDEWLAGGAGQSAESTTYDTPRRTFTKIIPPFSMGDPGGSR